MKNTIKFLFIAILIAVYGFNAKAQSNANADVTATATVLAQLTIAKTHNVVFGNLGATTAGAVYLDPIGVSSTYVGTTAAVGALTITGSTGATVQLGYPATIILENGDTPKIPMTYTLAVSGKISSAQSSSTLLLPAANLVTVPLTEGSYFLWVGGSLGTLAGQATGTYTGTANFTVTYN